MKVSNLPTPSTANALKFKDDDAQILSFGDATVVRFAEPVSPRLQADIIALVTAALDQGYRSATADIRRVINHGAP